MKTPLVPRLEPRRAPQFTDELRERARAWIPAWGLADTERDFGGALLAIAARFASEVAERLDGVGDKMHLGFLDWLAVQAGAARSARVPVALRLAATARDAVLAAAPVRLQADVEGTTVALETETDVLLIPGRLALVVGVDASQDRFFLPPPGLGNPEPLEPLPTQWQLKSFAAAGATRLQLDPPLGLIPGTLIEAGGPQYLIEGADQDLVTITPPLIEALAEQTTVLKVVAFAPFDDPEHNNRQEHALYLGDPNLLDMEAVGTIDVVGAQALRAGVVWQYWGKVEGAGEDAWQPLEPAEAHAQRPDALVLNKPHQGAIEPRELLPGTRARWLRAFSTKVPAPGEVLRIDEFALRLNAGQCDPAPACPLPADQVSPTVIAMANTTPLVLGKVFYPFGREPRQFDAFYLGSVEAFSKPGAAVQLCLQMADTTFKVLSAVQRGNQIVLAGVAADSALHLLRFDAETGAVERLREPLQPPVPRFAGKGIAALPAPASGDQAKRVGLDTEAAWPLPLWIEGGDILVAAVSDADVWVWRERAGAPTQSGWIAFGRVPGIGANPPGPVEGLLYLPGAPPRVAALRDGTLFRRDWSTTPGATPWKERTLDDTQTVLQSIVPVLAGPGAGPRASAGEQLLIGLAKASQSPQTKARLLCIDLSKDHGYDEYAPLKGTPAEPPVPPLAIRLAGALTVVTVEQADDGARVLRAYRTVATSPEDAADVEQTEVALAAGTTLVGAPAAWLDEDRLYVLAALTTDAGEGRLAVWGPFEDEAPFPLSMLSIPTGAGPVGGAPTALAHQVVVPGTRGDLWVADIGLSPRFSGTAEVAIGIVVPESVPLLVAQDLVTRESDGTLQARGISSSGVHHDSEVFYSIGAAFAANATGPLRAFQLNQVLHGQIESAPPPPGPQMMAAAVETLDRLILAGDDKVTKEGSWLRIGEGFHRVDRVQSDHQSSQRVATLDPGFAPPPEGTVVDYLASLDTEGRIAQYLRLDPSPNGNGNWDADLLTHGTLRFPDARPSRQSASAFEVNPQGHPVLVVLDRLLDPIPAPPAAFEVFATTGPVLGPWARQLGDTSTNPELSWEYWNGKGWWSLDITLDETLNLKSSGAVRFVVPQDMTATDWAGQTNWWIRARLIGGDYGRERVSVRPATPGGTDQTVIRSTDDIHAPQVLALHVSYALCQPVRPRFVVTQDSGSLRDQSDANRTPGAIVEVFAPLAVTLARLRGEAQARAAAAPPGADPGADPAGCDAQATTVGGTAATSGAAAAAAGVSAGARSLFVGLDVRGLTGTPVNLVLLVDERAHDLYAPMTVEALVADRFVPVLTSDGTRALGETGLLAMTLSVEPTPRELFGSTLTWLCLTPAAGADPAGWRPLLRGAYLNGVWASAMETLTRELVGSSEGAPGQRFYLARPPVLRDSLELRVREPLGEEERASLQGQDPHLVRTLVPDLPGDWVLWTRVLDPADAGPAERVYALDEATGEIRFGDGRYGRIPPAGRDGIVAFSYRRIEGGNTVPANAITARTALNLVSPVEGVETVYSVDAAAGGAPAEPVERTRRFATARLRHRGRALTASDYADLALDSSPDIVQARCDARRGQVRLTVVMRGSDPRPGAAQIRELRRLLLGLAPPPLAAPGALSILGPGLRALGLELRLRVASLDRGGTLAQSARQRLLGYFDSATGGAQQAGWPLGDSPGEDDIALALIDLPELLGIAALALYEVAADARLGAWPRTIRPTELVVLSPQQVHIAIETSEAGL